MLISGYWALLGNHITSKLLFPIGFLFFMVPVGDAWIPPLMEYTATFTVALLRLTSISVYREGFDFTLTKGSWSVIESCSGINSLISTITIGAVYSYLTFTRYWKRALFMLLCIAIPIIANGFRAYLIVLIGHLSNMKFGLGLDHFFMVRSFTSWYCFFCFILALCGGIRPRQKHQNRRLLSRQQLPNAPLYTCCRCCLSSALSIPSGPQGPHS